RATGRPEKWIKVRLEDFVHHQERELERLEKFLGIPLARIPVKTDPVGRHARQNEIDFPDFLNDALTEHGYV
ncbi:MAG: sulfotransferase, partial [Kiritimatiellaeota bacterium]|nr:sulfotransferase [Kiritimatiellota bacterium]